MLPAPLDVGVGVADLGAVVVVVGGGGGVGVGAVDDVVDAGRRISAAQSGAEAVAGLLRRAGRVEHRLHPPWHPLRTAGRPHLRQRQCAQTGQPQILLAGTSSTRFALFGQGLRSLRLPSVRLGSVSLA